MAPPLAVLPSALALLLALPPSGWAPGSLPGGLSRGVATKPVVDGSRGGAEASADTVEWRRLGLGRIPAGGSLLAAGRWLFHAGYSTPPGGGAEGEGGGSANQTNLGEIGWGMSDRVTLLLGMEINDDPTYAPVRGARRDRSWVTLALAARAGLGGRADAGPVGIAVQGSLQLLRLRSDPGLFNGGAASAVTTVPLAALDLPVTLTRSRWAVTLGPSVALLPREVMGAPFYGPTVRIGASGEVEAGGGWSLQAAGEVPLGPGENALERDGRFRRLPTWSVGVEYRATRRVVLAGAVTNAAGATPATRHLTLPSTPTTLYEIGIWYSPVAEPPEVERRSADLAEDEHAYGGTALDDGVGVPGAAALPAGRGRAAVGIDSEGGHFLSVSHALGRDVAFEILGARARGVEDVGGLGAGIGDGLQYRFGARIAFAHQDAGAPFSVGGRVTVGRDVDDQQGYLLAEAMLQRRLGGAFRVVLNPVLIQSARRSPTSLGVGTALRAGTFVFLAEGRASFSGEGPVWTAGLRPPDLGSVAVDAFLTNSSGPWELGRLLPRNVLRVGMVVRVAF